jgi:hypothetical protein
VRCIAEICSKLKETIVQAVVDRGGTAEIHGITFKTPLNELFIMLKFKQYRSDGDMVAPKLQVSLRICLLKEASDSQDKVYALLNLSIVLKIRINHRDQIIFPSKTFISE